VCDGKSEIQDTGSHNGYYCELHLGGELDIPKDVSREKGKGQIVECVEGSLRYPGNQLKVETEAGAIHILIPDTLRGSTKSNYSHNSQHIPRN
jgi:hypothetical protein